MNDTMLVLDTSILVHMTRRNRIWEKIQSQFSLFIHEPKPILSIVTVAEIQSLAFQYQWGKQKKSQIEFALANFDQVYIDDDRYVDTYVFLDIYTKKKGKILGKNDLWIASLAYTFQATLITCDSDFAILEEFIPLKIFTDER